MDTLHETAPDDAHTAVIKALFVNSHRQHSEANTEQERNRAELAFKKGAALAWQLRELAPSLPPNEANIE